MHLVYPLKFYITIIVFDFSWDDCKTQEKLEKMVMQNFGVNKRHYGLCEKGRLYSHSGINA